MSKDFNISMICLILNWFVYDPSWMMHLSEFLRTLRSSVLVVFNNFLLIDATARSKISSDQKRVLIALSLYPLSFFANTPFKERRMKRLESDRKMESEGYLNEGWWMKNEGFNKRIKRILHYDIDYFWYSVRISFYIHLWI